MSRRRSVQLIVRLLLALEVALALGSPSARTAHLDWDVPHNPQRVLARTHACLAEHPVPIFAPHVHVSPPRRLRCQAFPRTSVPPSPDASGRRTARCPPRRTCRETRDVSCTPHTHPTRDRASCSLLSGYIISLYYLYY